jgi:hypothetical protein
MGGDQEAYELATFMRTYGYPRTFVVNAPGSRYVELMTGYFQAAAKAKGIPVVGSESVAMSSPDVRSWRAIKMYPRPTVIFTAIPPRSSAGSRKASRPGRRSADCRDLRDGHSTGAQGRRALRPKTRSSPPTAFP